MSNDAVLERVTELYYDQFAISKITRFVKDEATAQTSHLKDQLLEAKKDLAAANQLAESANADFVQATKVIDEERAKRIASEQLAEARLADALRLNDMERLRVCVGYAPSGNWSVFTEGNPDAGNDPLEIASEPTLREAIDEAVRLNPPKNEGCKNE